MESPPQKLRVLVVDDSAYNRQTITAMLESLPGIEVVGRAMNGKEALQMAFDLEPDAITLDLEMPEMDGFAFLRLLMARRPTPVLVVSGYAQRENVFRALELGALDFIAKPSREISPDLKSIRDELATKIGTVKRLHAVRLYNRAKALAAVDRRTTSNTSLQSTKAAPRTPSGMPPALVVGIASSTGGPPAVQQILCALDAKVPIAILVAQHMPARFTRAFASRLDRLVDFHVVEAVDGHPLCAGTVYIAPGSANMEIERPGDGREAPMVRVVPPNTAKPGPVLTPSADHLFKSLAAQYGRRLLSIVLTGMGSDGREGAREARRLGGRIIAEDPDTAVMPGMPYSVIEAGLVDEVLPVEQIPEAIARFVGEARGGGEGVR
ncbi:chemotaxis-specific protein-glutamate methyltransferase CheB [Paraliomyxa miuraensis]|uniref:chemotaxis-specific protein-glutamate methyltransferase CheB n=1 Tax=Paraliomyxa miuraensis TaxID=376150 RepID=UPI00224D9473|nr:chemotaxis-specific protein-glutamate methyltransferase CheB [Paraliomyxa miuraensis]MCX4245785.1 chemotaxis-specific protein-glutamate methyltransferase CheB [Paraliomyxa miuraensis]